MCIFQSIDRDTYDENRTDGASTIKRCRIMKKVESEYTMTDYRAMVNRQRKWMLILLVLIAIGVLLLPYKTFFLGLLLGAVISFYNLWLLQRKIDIAGEAAAREGKRKGIGTISRLAAAALGVLIAIRFDLHIVAFIIGLMTAYPVIIIQYLLSSKR